MFKSFLPEVETDSSFEDLYNNNCFNDVVLYWNDGKDLKSQKMVLVSKSSVFKKIIEEYEIKNTNNSEVNPIKILLPNEIEYKIFGDIFKWFYTNSIPFGLEMDKYLSLLQYSIRLEIKNLQKILIIKYIIPLLDQESAIVYLNLIHKKNYTEDMIGVWGMFKEFCLTCIANHSNQIIRTKKTELLAMDQELLLQLVEKCIMILTEEGHLGNLLKLIIEQGGATDVIDLLGKLSNNILY